MPKSKRSAQVFLSAEAKVLKKLRGKNGLSMKAAGIALGCSPSRIAHIETGRMNPPTKDALHRLLKLYGDITPKYFQELCKNWEDEKTDSDIIREQLDYLSLDHLKIIRSMVEQMAQRKM